MCVTLDCDVCSSDNYYFPYYQVWKWRPNWWAYPTRLQGPTNYDRQYVLCYSNSPGQAFWYAMEDNIIHHCIWCSRINGLSRIRLNLTKHVEFLSSILLPQASPCVTIWSTVVFASWAMNPRTEKMTNPANRLVPQLMKGTNMASLWDTMGYL